MEDRWVGWLFIAIGLYGILLNKFVGKSAISRYTRAHPSPWPLWKFRLAAVLGGLFAVIIGLSILTDFSILTPP